MKRLPLLILSILIAASLAFAQEPKALATKPEVKPPPTVIPAPETVYLRWQVLKLRAANLQLQAQRAEEEAAKVLDEMDRQVGRDYTRFIDEQGNYQYRLNETPKAKEKTP